MKAATRPGRAGVKRLLRIAAVAAALKQRNEIRAGVGAKLFMAYICNDGRAESASQPASQLLEPLSPFIHYFSVAAMLPSKYLPSDKLLFYRSMSHPIAAYNI